MPGEEQALGRKPQCASCLLPSPGLCLKARHSLSTGLAHVPGLFHTGAWQQLLCLLGSTPPLQATPAREDRSSWEINLQCE